MPQSLGDEATKQVSERMAWTDDQLLDDVARQFTISLRMLSGDDAAPPRLSVFEMMRPRLKALICPRQYLFEYPESELVLGVCAVLLEVYSVHLAGSLAVYICRKGVRVLCP